MSSLDKISVLRDLEKKARQKRMLHIKSSNFYAKRNNILEGAVIAISSVAGLTGLSTSAVEKSTYIQVMIALLNICITMLSSFHKFFAMSEKKISHFNTSTKFSTLSKRIKVEMVMMNDNITNNLLNANDLNAKILRERMDEYNMITIAAPVIPESILAKYTIEDREHECKRNRDNDNNNDNNDNNYEPASPQLQPQQLQLQQLPQQLQLQPQSPQLQPQQVPIAVEPPVLKTVASMSSIIVPQL